MNRPKRHILIVGNGVAGITASRFIRKASDDDVTVVSAESDHFYSRPALMYIYMGHMRYEETKPYEDWFWEKNRIKLVRDRVRRLDTDERRAHLEAGDPITFDVLIIATGSTPNRFGWEGDTLPGVQGLYGLDDLKTLEAHTPKMRSAAVVGGGLIGVELSEMLHSRNIPVTFLVREASYMDYLLPPEESTLVNEQIIAHGINLRLGTEVARLAAGDTGTVGAVETKDGEAIGADFVGLTLGVRPNIGFLEGSGIDVGRGVLVNEYFETSVPDVYAIGDCAEFSADGIGHRRIEQLWYSGRLHGKAVARIISGVRRPYDRGVFYNSAKFFDLEYQTYGTVAAERPPDQDDVVLRDDEKGRMVRIRFMRDSGAVVGFNGMGVRLRHAVCEGWIRAHAPIGEVMDHFDDALFDPEFTRALEVPTHG